MRPCGFRWGKCRIEDRMVMVCPPIQNDRIYFSTAAASGHRLASHHLLSIDHDTSSHLPLENMLALAESMVEQDRRRGATVSPQNQRLPVPRTNFALSRQMHSNALPNTTNLSERCRSATRWSNVTVGITTPYRVHRFIRFQQQRACCGGSG
jgi:hypothetical protein